MSHTDDLVALARIFRDAREQGRRLPGAPAALASIDVFDADRVQFATADAVGPVGGWKVAQCGDAEGSFGVVFADDILGSPSAVALGLPEIRIEIEVAFRLARDLPPRPNGAAWSRDEVAAAIGGAFVAFELIYSRLPTDPKPSAVAARADRMSNLGLVVGRPVADWRALVHGDLAAELTIDGTPVVSQIGGHPSGDPFHPIVWLANALNRQGHGLMAGQVVTTGSFGGSHAMRPSSIATGRIEGFEPLEFGFLS